MTDELRKGQVAVLPWRVTLAIRVFGLALATGIVVSRGSAAESVPLLAALVLIAGTASTAELMVRSRGVSTMPVAEAALTSIVIATAAAPSGLLVYLAVPPIVAGVRHGAVTVVNSVAVAAIAVTASAALDGGSASLSPVMDGGPWLVVGLGVGLLASWQSRSLRELASRQAPYLELHSLVTQLQDVARRGALGIDPSMVAAELSTALRQSTDADAAAVFLVRGDGPPSWLTTHQSECDTWATASSGELPPHVHVVRMRVGEQGEGLGGIVLVREAGWDAALVKTADEVADEFLLRLDTAILFDDVRAMTALEERHRIARDMHDGVAQEIVALGYTVDEIAALSGPETRPLAESLRSEISRLVHEIRFSIFDLRHHVTDGHLASALTDYVREVSSGASPDVHLLIDESGPALSIREESEVLRVAQEAISNARRHASADNLWVTLANDSNRVLLQVEDDGVGNAGPRHRHWGLKTMQERASAIGADLAIEDRPGGGTVVRLECLHKSTLKGAS